MLFSSFDKYKRNTTQRRSCTMFFVDLEKEFNGGGEMDFGEAGCG